MLEFRKVISWGKRRSGPRRGAAARKPSSMLALPATVLCLAAAKSTVPLQFAGLGRYANQPALFLEDGRGGPVLPIPIPVAAEMALETALSSNVPTSFNVLLEARSFANRGGGIFDSLPWQWSSSPLAKRDGYSRLCGRDYPRGERRHRSAYALLLECIRRDCCAEIVRVLLSEAASKPADGTLVLCSHVELRRRLPEEGSAAALQPGDARRWQGQDGEGDVVSRGCAVDEAFGLAIALGATVHVQSSVWEAARRPPKYGLLRNKLRLVLPSEEEGKDARGRLMALYARPLHSPPPKLPWEWTSADEMERASPEEKALSVLAAGLRLPAVPDAKTFLGRPDVMRRSELLVRRLEALLEPLLSDEVRRELRVRRARDEGMLEAHELFTLDTVLDERESIAEGMESAIRRQDFGMAASLQAELQAETSYLDELLQAVPRPAYAPDSSQSSLWQGEEEEEDGGQDGGSAQEADSGWYELVRVQIERTERVRRERRLEQEFCTAFLREFGGQKPISELLESLAVDLSRYHAKEAALYSASRLRESRSD